MYRGFELEIEEWNLDEYIEIGKRVMAENMVGVKSQIDDFILKNESLDGSKMQSTWFPMVQADIFLSHSHADLNKALGLAGWLSDKLSVKTFIDSSVWLFADELLKKVDDKYCLNNSGETYSYQKRNGSTSHVHMMLNASLMKMIDKCEAFFLLKTENSISTEKAINETATLSPWIYSEVVMSELIRKKPLSAYRSENFTRQYSINENVFYKYNLSIEHTFRTGHLTAIKQPDFNSWNLQQRTSKYVHPLNLLYKLKP